MERNQVSQRFRWCH